MKNKFKLLTLAVCGALYVGESLADENFFLPRQTYSTGFLNFPNPELPDVDDVVAFMNYGFTLRFQDCLIDAEENNRRLYSCTQIDLHDLRPSDDALRINGKYTSYDIELTQIIHGTFLDPGAPEGVSFGIRTGITTVSDITLLTVCPSGISSQTFNFVSGVGGERYCIRRDTSADNRSLVGNPINYISRQKVDSVVDFQGVGALQLSRNYINQNLGWSLIDTPKLVDLYHVELGEAVNIDFYNSVTNLNIAVLNSENGNLERGVTTVSEPVSYVVPNEANRKVLIADEHGVTQSFFGGPTNFKSAVDSSLLIFTPENGEIGASWKLVDPNGVQQIFDSAGNVTEARYSNGDIIYYQYDEQGRVVRKDNKLGDYIAYEYLGNLVKATVMPENIVFDYVYETVETGTYPRRLTEVKQDQQITLKYQYDDLAYPLAMTSVTDANDVVLARWGYALNGDATLTSPNNEGIFSINYARSISGPRTVGGSEVSLGTGPEITNPSGSTTSHVIRRIAGYDRVVATVDRSFDGSSVQAEFLTYDSLGNITTETDSNGDVAYKVYDSNRFLISERTGYRWKNDTALNGTISNPLSSLVGTEIETTNFCWDSNTGLRTKIITDDLVTTFVYSELGQIISTIEEPANSTNNTCN